MDTNIIAVFSVTAIGVISAAVLCVASKIMYVKSDEALNKMLEGLPGTNCGACGFTGCSGYAKALLSDPSVKNDLCTPGGDSVLKMISRILGVEAGKFTKKTAIVHCLGDNKAQQKKMDYKGLQSCEAAKRLYGGEGACAFGCLGYGDCLAVCPDHGICMENSLARINTNCTGCGLCVKACPNNLITIEDVSLPVFIACNNIERGALARKKCLRACLGCGKCMRECPEKAITVEDNLARIDHEKCRGCGHCVDICVAKCMKERVKVRGKR